MADFDVKGNELKAYLGSSKDVTIPSTVTVIGDGAFASTDIASVIIHDGVTKIGDGAFENCVSLTQVSIPKHLVRSVEDLKRLFKGCKKIKFTFRDKEEPKPETPVNKINSAPSAPKLDVAATYKKACDLYDQKKYKECVELFLQLSDSENHAKAQR